MRLTGLHILLTDGCVYECDHCFVWGSCASDGVFTLDHLDVVIEQALQLGTVRDFYFEGGETFVYYPALITAVRRASRYFRTTIVTNGYWARTLDDACTWLGRLAEAGLRRVEFAPARFFNAARQRVDHPGIMAADILGLESVLHHFDAARGRDEPRRRFASGKSGDPGDELTDIDATREPWSAFSRCPYLDLANPDQAHVDPAGTVHLCPGLVIGNLFQSSLSAIAAGYEPEAHPLIGPLVAGGPAGLVRQFVLAHEHGYFDACQLCYESRALLRSRFPELIDRPRMNGLEQAVY